jgi:NAD+ kinase
MTIGIIGNTQKAQIGDVILQFVHLLEKYSAKVLFSENLKVILPQSKDRIFIENEDMGADCDFVISFGGDGTMLSAVNDIGRSNTPILGVNMGGLGFLAEVVVEEMDLAIQSLLAGEYTISERMMLQGIIHTAKFTETIFALNDCIIDKGSSARLLYIEAQVDDVLLNTYRSDGVIVSTPTGSTAYSLAAGGPIVVPRLNAILVTPICPHSLTVRPIVLSDESVLKLSIGPEQATAQIHFDGRGKYDLHPGDWVEVKKADYAIKWVSLHHHDFYEIIRSKLNWGVDLPINNNNREN